MLSAYRSCFADIFPLEKISSWDYSELKQGQGDYSVFKGFKLQGDYNSYGLRDREYQLKHDTFRVLAVGDSFTYGLWLKNENSWPKMAEEALRKKGFLNIEILNGGRPDTDTKWQLEFFKAVTAQYRPDMVVIGFIINDCTTLCSNCAAANIKYRLDTFVKNANKKRVSMVLDYVALIALKNSLTKATLREYFDAYENLRRPFLIAARLLWNLRNYPKQ